LKGVVQLRGVVQLDWVVFRWGVSVCFWTDIGPIFSPSEFYTG
jgi:hypothetical protein